MQKTTMNICLVVILIAVSCTVADGALSWGTFLGADWKLGEQSARKDLSVFIKNTQRVCTKDVEKLCESGRYVTARAIAYTNWSERYDRHLYKTWEDVPLGFGSESDVCLRRERDRYRSGTETTRLIPKCVEWLEKTEGQFEKIQTKERGNDRREAFVVFSTLFATAVSGAVGYMFGMFLKERDDLFSYNNRAENKKLLVIFCVAMSVPLCVILWASRRLFLLMAAAFGAGRAAQWYVQRRRDGDYGRLSTGGSDSGLVFAAIPVQMD